jgi:hypothetical protein
MSMIANIRARFFFAGLLMLPLAGWTAVGVEPSKSIHVLADTHALIEHFKALGYKSKGGVDKATTDRDETHGHSFPHFSSSFSVGGVTYPYTMVGHRPQSGRSASLKSVIIPLRMNFVGFGPNFDINRTFEPAPAVKNMIHSSLYVPAKFPNGVGQFVDQMQRAAFWNQMDEGHRWHVVMDEPRVLEPIDIEVTPATGGLQTDTSGNPIFGDVLIDFMDSQARTILQLLHLDADILPIFVTDNVTADVALGYHTAYPIQDDENETKLQTFIYTSWLDPALVPPIFADVSTFNHELAEWMNDPFTNNATPDWVYPPPTDPAAVCSQNPLLEVGDPQGNGPTYTDFPAFESKIDGVTYHLQQLVLWQWFTDEVPSSAFGGWYTFPIPSSLRVPAVYCP